MQLYFQRRMPSLVIVNALPCSPQYQFILSLGRKEGREEYICSGIVERIKICAYPLIGIKKHCII